MGVTENQYTTLTPADLDKAHQEMTAAIQKRDGAYNTELERQRSNDDLCKSYANTADPFSKWLLKEKQTMGESKAELKKQLEYVMQRIGVRCYVVISSYFPLEP
jgi:hypothetical protein